MKVPALFKLGALSGPWSIALLAATFVSMGLIYKSHSDGIRDKERARFEAEELRGQAQAARIQAARLKEINANYLQQINQYKARSAQSVANLRRLEANGNETTKDYLSVRVVDDMCDWLRDVPAAFDLSHCGTDRTSTGPLEPDRYAEAVDRDQRRFVPGNRGTF